MKFILSVVVCLFLVSAVQADVIVKGGLAVQEYENLTPVKDIGDTTTFVIQVGTSLTDVTSVGGIAIQTDDGDFLVGPQITYGFPLTTTPATLYGGIGLLGQLDDLVDTGLIVTAVAGIDMNIKSNVGGYAEARSISRLMGEKETTVGLGVGLRFAF